MVLYQKSVVGSVVKNIYVIHINRVMLTTDN